MLAKKQAQFFAREIKRVERMQKKHEENIPILEAKYKPKYKTAEEINQAYLIGAIDEKELHDARVLWWRIYSDRYMNSYLRWLRQEHDYYQAKHDRYIQANKDAALAYGRKKAQIWNKEQHRKAYYRKYRRAERKRKKGPPKRPVPRKRVNRCTQEKPSDTSCIKKEDTTQTKQSPST